MGLKLLIYDRNCFDLARSIIYKSDLLAIETEMQINPANYAKIPRSEWLYYLNLAGLYHPLNEPMIITSHDTLMEIPFDKETLKKHTITRSKYTPTSDFTKALIRQHPNNASLIQGIIYDIPIERIINADELEIIAYDDSLVNVGECDLITDIQTALRQKFGVALNKDYLDVEPGYIDVLTWKICQSLPYEVKYARMLRHRTTWASEFDMWTYINSHVYLEDLNYALTRADVVYLYKNIDRLTRDSGSNNVLMELIKRFLTDRNVDTYQLQLLRDLSSIDELHPENKIKLVEYKLDGYGTREASVMDYTRLGDTRSHTKIVNYPDILERRMLHSDDHITTRELKILELLEDSSDTQLLLVDIDLFVQAVARGIYDSRHTIINHMTGETHRLTSVESIILYMYVVACKLGRPPEFVGYYNTHIVPVLVIPSIKDMMDTYALTLEQAQTLTSLVPQYPHSRIDTATLETYIANYKESIPNIKRFFIANTTYYNQIAMSQLEGSLYEWDNIQLLPGKVAYSSWLQSLAINLKNYKQSDYIILEDTILRNVFGIDLMERTSHRSTGIAELLKRFCSYRLNITARADSANMINYRLAPLQILSEVSTESYLVTEPTLDVNLLSSIPDYNIRERIDLVAIGQEPYIDEETPLRIDYNFVEGIITSNVVSDSIDHVRLNTYLDNPKVVLS